MNIAMSAGFLALNVLFLLAYLFNFALNLFRDFKVQKMLKTNPQTIPAVVKEVHSAKRRTHVLVEFTSPQSRILFNNTFEFVPTDKAEELYHGGQEVNLSHIDPTNLKKVYRFPLILEGQKAKLEKGPLFTNAILIFLGAFNTINVLISLIKANALVDNTVMLTEVFGSPLYLVLIIFLYVMLLSYLIDSLIAMPVAHNYNYLKVYGTKAIATVKTFKFGGAKNAKGLRESRMEIEYYTSKGEFVKTRLNSYLYSETQEEFINIIYDPKKATNVVYLKQ
jgi:hypothetical protein